MKKLPIDESLGNKLSTMLAVLYPKQEVIQLFKDGVITLQCRHCQKTINIHWYELLLDHILTAIAKRLYTSDWHVHFIAMLTEVFAARFKPKKGTIPHPVNTVYDLYFIPNLALLKEITENERSTELHKH